VRPTYGVERTKLGAAGIPPISPVSAPTSPSDAEAITGGLPRVAATMYAVGLRVDPPLVYRRVDEAERHKSRLREELLRGLGLPRHSSTGQPAVTPWTSSAGRRLLDPPRGDLVARMEDPLSFARGCRPSWRAGSAHFKQQSHVIQATASANDPPAANTRRQHEKTPAPRPEPVLHTQPNT